MDKVKNLGPEYREKMAADLSYAFDTSYQAGAERRSMVDTWRRVYNAYTKPKPLKWMSNLCLPLAKYMVNSSAIKLSAACLGTDPMFEVIAEDPRYDDASHEEERYMQMWVERIHLRTKGGEAIKRAMIDGVCWLQPGIKSTGVKLSIPQDEPLSVDELDVIPGVDYVLFDDMMVLPFSAPCFEEARGAFARKWLSWQNLKTFMKIGAFAKEAVDAVGLQWQTMRPQTEVEMYRGIDTEEPRAIWDGRFECWEGIYRWTKPGDTSEKDWLVTVYYPLDRSGPAVVLRANEYYPIFGSRWFFVPIIVNPEPNSLWGNSLVEDLQHMQAWMNSTFNQASDAITINIHPPTAVGTSGMSKNLKWGPMEKWPVMPQEVQVMHGNDAAITGVAASPERVLAEIQ